MERIIKELEKHPEISDWRIRHCRATGFQMYVIGNMLDSIRKVISDRYYVTIYRDQAEFRGATELTIYAHDLDRLEKRVEQAIFVAGRIRNKAYGIPAGTLEEGRYPFVETFDPAFLRDIKNILFQELADRLITAVHREQGIRLSSSEYFIDLTDIHLKNSQGIDLTYKTSKLFFDGVLLAGQPGSEVETHFELRARRLQDLPIESIVPRYARYARDSVGASIPSSGRHAVVVSDDALSCMFGPLLYNLSGENRYRGTSRLKIGQSIHQQLTGEPLTILSNGFIPFGLMTRPADPDGIPTSRFELIREGVFERAWTSKRDADYLGIEPTGRMANLEIPIGPSSMESFLNDDGTVLQIVEFAAVMPDMISGNFASEIRLGYEYRGNSVRPVKGGSISGNLISGFDDARYSTESQFANYGLSFTEFGSYIGPRAIKFGGFQVTGE